MGYIAIKGNVPTTQEEIAEYNTNKDYYKTMGILLNHNARRRFSWMKSVYRRYRHGLLNCLVSDLNKRGIVTNDMVDYILNNLEVVRDGPSFYNINHYIHYFCEIVNITNTSEKNLFMSLLTDEDGIEFVENYEKTKYITRRRTCNDGVITIPDDFYVKVLPNGLTKDDINIVHEFENELVMPMVHVVSEIAHGNMVDNPELVEETASCRIGNHQYNIRVKQKGTGVNEDGEPIDVYGQVIVSNTVDLGTHQADYDACVEAISEVFEKSFGSDNSKKK